MIALNKILLVYIRYLKFDVFVQILRLKIVFATSERERGFRAEKLLIEK